MVRDFHKVIGEEARAQILRAEKRLPDLLFACVGGGSNAIGLFHAFLGDASVKMVGVEAGGRGKSLGEHAARLAAAAGYSRRASRRSARDVHLRSANARRANFDDAFRFGGTRLSGDWAGARVARRSGTRGVYRGNDEEAIDAARTLARIEGIIPALESAHALAELIRRAPRMSKDEIVILNLSGRGDKDMDMLSHYV